MSTDQLKRDRLRYPSDLTDEEWAHVEPLIFDSIAWAHDRLLPKLLVRRKVAAAVLHPSCSVNHLKLTGKLHALAAALADTAVTPVAAGCCAFAGDRGLLHTELTRSATAEEAAEARSREFDAYLGSNRTCEIGLNLATGRDYEFFCIFAGEIDAAGGGPRGIEGTHVSARIAGLSLHGDATYPGGSRAGL